MKWGTTKGVKYREGDPVEVGRGGFGRPRKAGVVAKEWDGESGVMVVLEGKTKPQSFASSMVRHAERQTPVGPPLKATRPSTTKAKLRAVPRPLAPARSPKYLTFVRSHACCACQRTKDVEAHHWAPPGRRGLAQKVSDFRTVPLCPRCHEHFHRSAPHVLPGLDARTSHERFLAVQVELMDEWLSRVLERSKARRAHAAG